MSPARVSGAPAAALVLLAAALVPIAAALVPIAAPQALASPRAGDGRVVTGSPRPGYALACRAPAAGGRRPAAVPWVEHGRYARSRRPVVGGTVEWRTASFALTASGALTVFHGNGLPSGSATGIFPPLRRSAAAPYAAGYGRIAPRTVRGSFPAHPARAKHPSCIEPGEQVGIAVDGTPILAAFDAHGRDVAAREVTDRCGGRTTAAGLHLYREGPRCLGHRGPRKASGLVGYARDGFPIYGPRGAGGRPIRSADLDACHGRRVRTKGAGSSYRYHLTADFPYTVGCLRGKPARDWRIAAPRGPAGGGASGPVGVDSAPGLFPAFDPGVHDYVTRCDRDTPVELSFDAAGSTRVSVDGQRPRGGSFTVPVDLVAGRRLGFAIDTGPDAGTYRVRCLPADFPRWSAERTGTPSAAGYVLTPHRSGSGKPGYVGVFDNRGVPVWWKRDLSGHPDTGTLLPGGHIAWYTYTGGGYGTDPRTGFGEYTLAGRRVRRYRAVGVPTDFHELELLPNRHALVIAYRPRDHVDLSRWGGPPDATVVFPEIQELDRRGRLVWSWSTRGHIGLAEGARWYRYVPPTRLPDGRLAYDYAHLNSVDARGGKLLISVRHADAIYEIDRRSGRIDWKLGGTATPKSLAVAGDPFSPRTLGGQHDARFSPDGRFVTVHDNRTLRSAPPRAVRYAIDRATMTATLVESVSDPEADVSLCCGSARRLPDGHWTISWGGTNLVTEVDAAGARVLAIRLRRRSSYRADPILPGELPNAALRRGMDAMAP